MENEICELNKSNEELKYDNKYLSSENKLLDDHNKMIIEENVNFLLFSKILKFKCLIMKN